MNTQVKASIASVLKSRKDRIDKARKITDLIRNVRAYRWVGVYDVSPELVSIIAYSGPGAPAYLSAISDNQGSDGLRHSGEENGGRRRCSE